MTKQDAAYAVLMVLVIMGLAVYAAGPAAGLLVAAVVAGIGVAVLRIRRGSR